MDKWEVVCLSVRQLPGWLQQQNMAQRQACSALKKGACGDPAVSCLCCHLLSALCTSSIKNTDQSEVSAF